MLSIWNRIKVLYTIHKGLCKCHRTPYETIFPHHTLTEMILIPVREQFCINHVFNIHAVNCYQPLGGAAVYQHHHYKLLFLHLYIDILCHISTGWDSTCFLIYTTLHLYSTKVSLWVCLFYFFVSMVIYGGF